jgi:hypothetical protein
MGPPNLGRLISSNASGFIPKNIPPLYLQLCASRGSNDEDPSPAACRLWLHRLLIRKKNGRRKTPRYCSPRAAYVESTRESDGQEKLRGECRQLVDSGAVRAGSSTRIGCRDPTTGRCQVSARCGLSKSRTEREVRKWGRKRIRRKGASTCFFRGLLRVLLERKQCHSALFLHLRDGI